MKIPNFEDRMDDLSDCPICKEATIHDYAVRYDDDGDTTLCIQCVKCGVSVKGSHIDLDQLLDGVINRWESLSYNTAIHMLFERCPCCGEGVLMNKKDKHGGLYMEVYCINCDISMTRIGTCNDYRKLIDSLRKSWNKRTVK